MTIRVSQTTPATRWELVTVASMPRDLSNKVPKGIFVNAAGNVQLVGSDGVAVTFTLAEGVVLPLRPRSIQGSTVDVVVLFD